MGEGYGSNRYSDRNDIKGLDGATDFGINSDVNSSNAGQGQGGGRGKKPQGEGHKIEYHMKRTSQYKIYNKRITATKGESDAGISSFDNLVVDCSNGGQGQGSREFIAIYHNIDSNVIFADHGSTKVWVENFGNINYNYKTSSTKDHGKAAGGSSSAQGQGRGGGKKPECNLKTTNTEDRGSTNQSRISKNKIEAYNGASNAGIFNFHNVYVNGQGGCEGNEVFLKRKGISHNINENTIIAVNSRKVGIQNFGNIKYNCESIIGRVLNFLGLSF